MSDQRNPTERKNRISELRRAEASRRSVPTLVMRLQEIQDSRDFPGVFLSPEESDAAMAGRAEQRQSQTTLVYYRLQLDPLLAIVSGLSKKGTWHLALPGWQDLGVMSLEASNAVSWLRSVLVVKGDGIYVFGSGENGFLVDWVDGPPESAGSSMNLQVWGKDWVQDAASLVPPDRWDHPES